MKLSNKLYSAFGVLIVLMVMSSTLVWFKVATETARAQEVTGDDLPGMILYSRLLDTEHQLKSAALEYMNGDTSKKSMFNEVFRKFKEVHTELYRYESAKQADREKMAHILKSITTYHQRVNQDVFGRYDPDAYQRIKTRVDRLESTTGEQLESLLDKLKEQEFNDAMQSTDLQESLNDDLPGVRYYLELVDEAGDMIAAIISHTTGNANAEADFNDDAASFEEYLNLLIPLEQKPNELQDIATIKRLYKAIRDEAATVFSSYDPTAFKQATATLSELDRKYIQDIAKILDVSAKEEIDDATGALELLVEGLNSTSIVIIVITLIAAILGMAIAYIISSSIVSRLNQVLGVAERISAGDISDRDIVHKGQDEIDGLAEATNKMARSLNELLHSIAQVVDDVRTSSHDIAEANDQIASRSRSSADQSTQVATAIEEMSATVSEVASQSQVAASHADQARTLASGGGDTVGQTVSKIKTASQNVQKTAENVTHLGELSSQIGNVIGVIGSIAEQTNLLALNAAIEAARAGEQGRGFAVVADEVRTLAERTSKATEEVVSTVQSIQSQTEHAVSSMQNSVSQVDQSVSMAEAAGTQLDDIVRGASEIASMIQSIATATEEQSVVAGEMARDISKIEQSSQSSLQDTQVAALSAQELNKQAEQLAQLVRKFRLRT
ncbi:MULTISPECIES: methyl-accepting chemotaxis protein [unclassified Pseudoalteromonas]|uniref:methyl-accepting chemotaxis protein n=1 Tax=unclassified Pseudoalteromonas TaxID=194690 RepID=UPI002096C9EB|nr:methyl-accepting chemotaxis protein [Pseudoalteromonas sp. XMcav2-N]MCO7190278.1 methyl-accepting chemotaxis protein [Pseudoalteromonas sp. XMcav2-N]